MKQFSYYFSRKFEQMSFTVYKSSAGSGKTYTLVREYLKIAIAAPDGFRRILAVTFTNKAANEMKERVIVYLREIAEFEENSDKASVKNMLPQLEKELGLPKKEIADRAETVLKKILHNYSDFAISTIDSFMHKIIRTFAYDLHLAQDFDVEMDTDELMSKVVDILISEVGNDEALTKILINFVSSRADDEKNWHIESDLMVMAKGLVKEDAQLYVERLRKLTLTDFEDITKKVRGDISAFENRIVTSAKSAVEKIDRAGIPSSAFYQGRSGINVYFGNLANKRFDKLHPNSYVLKTVEEDKWYGGKATFSEKSAIDSVKGFLTDVFLKLQKEIEENYERYVLLHEIWKNLYPLAVLSEIEKILDEYKRNNKIIHISEFNKLIAGIVAEQPVPFIYERVGEKYRNFLIDEFQDTSILQWHNMLPLVENSLSNANFNMVVGDGKQAIYRWRSGEVEQFARLPEIYKRPDTDVYRQREDALKRNYNPQVLKANYRSRAEIVKFNNEFFEVIAELIAENLRPIYDNAAQEFNPSNKGGFVSVEFLKKSDDDDKTLAELNIERTLEIVAELIDDGYGLEDIAILCRKNKEANLLAINLIDAGYNVVSSESLLIKNSPDVRFLVDILQFLNDGDNNIAKAGILHYLYLAGKLPGTLHSNLNVINVKAGDGEKDLFNQEESFAEVLQKIGFNPKTLKKQTLYDSVEDIIRRFGIRSRADVYVRFFLDMVLEFETKNSSGIPGFLEWWDKKKNSMSVVVPEGIDAVRVMTVHKSKGLEFPVVIFPFAKSGVKSAKKKLWVDISKEKISNLEVAILNTGTSLENTGFADQYREEMDKSFLDLVNIVYVVMTRPSERLYVLTEMPPKNKEKTDSIPKFFHYFLSEKGLWQDEQTKYEFGERVLKKTDEEKPEEQLPELNLSISNPWHNRVLLSLKASEHWDTEDKLQSREYGTLIHSVLSKIKVAGDIEDVLIRLETDGIIGENEISEIGGKIVSFIGKPSVAGYFAEGLDVKTEPEILLSDGRVIRPDRLIFDGDMVTVIDFKTGKPSEKHKRQVENYKEKMRELGFEKVFGVLLYLNENEPVLEVE